MCEQTHVTVLLCESVQMLLSNLTFADESNAHYGRFLTMTFQALSRDLLHVSVQLESVEEKLRSRSSVRQTGGVTIEELEEERDLLKKRRDTLDTQLRDNRVLTDEVRKKK